MSAASHVPAAARFWRPALLLGGLLAAGVVARRIPLDAALHVTHSPQGMLLFLPVAALLCAAGVPRQAVAYATGYWLDLGDGMAVAMAAQLLGCALDLLWARGVARDWARRRLHGRLARLDRMLASQPFTATLLLRLLPVGNNLLLNLLAGVSSVPPLPFLAGSAVGFLPQTLVFVLAGTGTRLGQGSEVGLGVALFAASAALGVLLYARLRRASPATAATLNGDAANASCAAIPMR